MKHQLTKREYMWIGTGPILTYDHPIGYEVEGMPFGYRAFINNFGAPCADDWQIRIERNDRSTGWFGAHVNADAALAAINRYVIELVN